MTKSLEFFQSSDVNYTSLIYLCIYNGLINSKKEKEKEKQFENPIMCMMKFLIFGKWRSGEMFVSMSMSMLKGNCTVPYRTVALEY